jgi:hypothetical protein
VMLARSLNQVGALRQAEFTTKQRLFPSKSFQELPGDEEEAVSPKYASGATCMTHSSD